MMVVALTLLPVLATVFAALVVAHAGPPADARRRQQIYAVIAVASLIALIDYPYFAWIYFYYYAPLVILAAVAVFSRFGRPGGQLIGATLLACVVSFVVARMPKRDGSLMALPRGGILVPASDSAEARGMTETLRAHARNGVTFATPDCPEVYFLSGLANPTRT